MAGERILQNEIARLGQSQDERSPPALNPGFAPVDGRAPVERLAEARRLAEHLRHYAVDPTVASGDWRAFFPAGDAAALLARDDGTLPPHLGLFGAFLEMLEPARGALNGLTARHLDFQYRLVLGFAPLPAQPEHAHLTLELKKGATPFAVTPEHRFTAGKDASGAERLYKPLRETLVGQGRVTALHSVHRDAGGVRFAPLADSADGLGTPLDPARPQWPAFGHAGLAAAPVGFALASPVLRMQEGRREVSIVLDLAFIEAAGLDGQGIADGLQAFVTGDKGWLGPYALTGARSGGRLTLGFAVPEGEPAVVDYAPAVHGQAFATALPVVQLLLRPEAAGDYAALAKLRVDQAGLTVAVDGLKTLNLENDFGGLNPKKAFQPFGPQPVKGSRFMVGCAEALSKQLTDLKIRLRWQGAPGNLGTWYSGYGNAASVANGVAARLVYQDRSGSETTRELDLMQRADGVTTLSPNAPAVSAGKSVSEAGFVYSMMTGGSFFSRMFGKRFMKTRPLFLRETVPAPPLRSGYVTVALVDDFLHADYRRETMEHAKTTGDKTVLNEPYTPTVQEITLAYAAKAPTADLTLDDEDAFAASLDLQFFHVGPFGQRREHPFLRRSLGWVADKKVALLPAWPDEGEFIVGVAGVAAGDSIHLLLQVAEGSADPELAAQPVRWSVLCDNHWRAVAAEEMALYTSRGLRASGIVLFFIARATT